MIEDSEIIHHKGGGVSFIGPDAVAYFRAATIWSGLGLWIKCKIKPSAGYTPTAMLKAAGEITGKTYKRGQYQSARDDLKIWIDEMKAALPTSGAT